jgi:uncharacterized protein YlxW (UPF0749 family)
MAREAKLSIDMAPVARGGVSKSGRHNERTEGQKHSNPDIDDSRTHLNYNLVDTEGMTLLARTDRRIKEGRTGENSNRKIQKNAILLQSHVIQVNKEYFDELGPEKTREFFQATYDHYCKKFGKENIVSAEVHMDEKSPHIHIMRVPLEHGRLVGGEFRRKQCIALHTDAHRDITARGFEVQRGEPSKVDKERVDLATFKARELKSLEQVLTLKQNELNALQAKIDAKEKELAETNKATEQELATARDRLAEAQRNSATVNELIAINQRVKQVGGWFKDNRLEISIPDYNALSETARVGADAIKELPELKKELAGLKVKDKDITALTSKNKALSETVQDLHKKIDGLNKEINTMADQTYKRLSLKFSGDDVKTAAVMLRVNGINESTVRKTIMDCSPSVPSRSSDARGVVNGIIANALNRPSKDVALIAKVADEDLSCLDGEALQEAMKAQGIGIA